MAAVLGHGLPTGALQRRRHCLNHDLTGTGKCHPERKIDINWTVEALLMDGS